MFDVREFFVVGVGAALGGMLRFVVTTAVIARAGAAFVPFATLFINVSGSFAIGIVIGMVQARGDSSPLLRLFLATGLLGGYTTFSTFSYEALALSSNGATFAAVGYVVGSVALGLGAAYAGLFFARILNV